MGTQATQVTQGIQISVSSAYQSHHSVAAQRHYLFSYRISIENKSGYTIKLIARHWEIFDSSNEFTQVKGEGVVGEQPVLEPGQKFEYESACSLTSDIGKMRGTYEMERQMDKSRFIVHIPEFELITPERLN
jgi:ApaG protein